MTGDGVFLAEVRATEYATFFPLGFPVEVSTNSSAVMAAARESWGMFHCSHREAPVSICLLVSEDGDALPPSAVFRTQGHLMSIVADAGNHAICDFSRGCAVGWVTRRAAERAEFLRFQFLEAAAMTMLVAAHFAPVHAALVTRRGMGVALCGESLAGKSTLAYSCAREGWTFISDDATFVLRNRAGRQAVGNPYRARFREQARVLFPELENCRFAPKLNGAPGMEIETRELGVKTAGECFIDHLVFLRRSGAGPARIERFDAERALAWLERESVYGPAEVQASVRETYRRLLGAEIWELHYSDVRDAVNLLERL